MPPREKGLRCISEADQAAISAIARSGIGIAGITYDELSDIKQELALKLIRKAHLFRSRRQKWGTFRKVVLERCLSDLIRLRMQPGYYAFSLSNVSLNEEIKTENDDFSDDASGLIDMVTSEGLLADNTEKPELPDVVLKIDMDDFLATLSPKLRRICELLKNYSAGETAEILKISRRTLYRRIGHIRKGMIAAEFVSFIFPQNGTLSRLSS